jgi:hypothetical protein
MVTHNQSLVRYIGELGIYGAHVGSGGTTSLKIGGSELTCSLSTNDFQISFPGFKATPEVIVQNVIKQTDPCVIAVASKSTSTVTITPYTVNDATTTTNGGTATVAAFDILVMGPTYL